MVYSNFYACFHTARQKVGVVFRSVGNLRVARWYLAAASALQLLAWVQALYIYRNLAGALLVRHYNVDLGIDLVGDAGQIFYYPLFALVVLILNFVVAALNREHRNFRIFVQLLLAAALVFTLLINVTLFFVYLINFR
ncbi:hypothetical protein GW920_03415 [Candidatus Falkowbacteria bacterium]|uniref:Uncharacterized protein n=1 Tax=Candidatus Falkowbacteria bacterium CG10_big_fil_rev_8_21_14_0_10_37_18 TaxID=1974562 RepID=A0A2H0V8Z2_9BACT|nr:hypothetical protein [Candidatus Falkowbacteria bacterium]NCQ12573.1 hypothetical protein [Candidatus Falkowbacteria bacterium]OIO05599.1 MAG: hypothetical protein AUJ26_02855 [Candidatus Falkowbacteria bacterium CG1_02_37_21]PIR95558.1 MAG: hypothetical protein COT93_01995 [Candidatus Falkowbacteria bacterium CG10_big_fil_rev_8_21_14_0_10_37_18]